MSKEKLPTTIHLLPSNSFRGGFLVLILSGFGFLPGGAGDLLRPIDESLPFRSGTGALALKDGFLWVIWLASTFLRPAVTADPLLSCSNTAPISPPAFPFGGGGGGSWSKLGSGGGGGGGGGPPAPGAGGAEGAAAPPAFTSFRAWAASTPSLFQVTPVR